MTTPDPDQDRPPAAQPVKLWDLPVRITHWSFVLLLPLMWWTEKVDRMDLHKLLGYAMLGLVLFRLFWGVAGSSTARFRAFLRGPRAVVDHVRASFAGRYEPAIGHNPLGGWSAVALLGLLGLQVGLGLIAMDEEGIVAGPLADHVSFATSESARDWHELVFKILLGFIGLHVAAILFYLAVKRDNLIGAMLTGSKRLPSGATQPSFAPAWKAALAMAAAGALAFWISSGAPGLGL
jgi:cytochrome b